MNSKPNISESIDVLNNNIEQVARVEEWAEAMGYQRPKKFSRKFLLYFAVRPCSILTQTRLKSIYRQLQTRSYSNFEIARQHSMPDEKALNKFVKYHLDCCPRQLQAMSEDQFYACLEKFGSKIVE